MPARPVPNFGCPGPSRPLARFLACPVVPLSRDNKGASVPLSRKVELSRPVGNPLSNFESQNFAILDNFYSTLETVIGGFGKADVLDSIDKSHSLPTCCRSDSVTLVEHHSLPSGS